MIIFADHRSSQRDTAPGRALWISLRRASAVSLAALALIFACTLAQAAPFDPFAGPKPLAVLIEQNPWLMVIGSDMPRVAVYENGDVVFLKKEGDTYAYHAVTLNLGDLATLEQKWLPLLQAKGLAKNYDLSSVTDQPSTFIYLRRGDQSLAVSAYGLNCRHLVSAKDAGGDQAPAVLLDVHKSLCAVNFPESRVWVPKYIEVMLWSYEYAPEASVQWPKEWPSLRSERAWKRGNAYSIFLDGSELPKLQAFLATRKERGAVEIDGKKWAIAYRDAFPSEPIWRAAMFK